MADEENAARYRGVLVSFMSYIDRNQYDEGFVFTREHLAEVSADDVAAWFNYKVYGTPTPSVEDRPTNGRSSSLLHYKKAISFFMPNLNHQWN